MKYQESVFASIAITFYVDNLFPLIAALLTFHVIITALSKGKLDQCCQES